MENLGEQQSVFKPLPWYLKRFLPSSLYTKQGCASPVNKQASKNVPPVLKCQRDGKSTAKQTEKV